MQLTNGTLLHGGTYKIEKVLGQGSFGITYLAEHVHLGRKVAIKEFFMKELNSRSEDGSITGMSDGSLSYNYAQKFKKEAFNLSRLDHPNIVRVTDSFEDNGTFYYVMDFIDGMNLNDYIKSSSPSEQTAVGIIKEVANALEYMHEEKQMLHLDLKPGNVMRRKSDGHVFLIDFGLSKHYDANGAPETSTTIGLGTAGYAPVEQANQAKNGDFRPTIDVYSLGATLYKLLTHDTPPAASELVSDDELLPEKMKEKGISQPLIDLVVKAMLPNVRKRIQTIREFKELLQDASTKSASSIGTAIANGAETITADDEEANEVGKSEETVVVGNSEETELMTNKAIQGNEADYEKFEEKQYGIPSSYITNIDETLQNASSGNVGAMLALGFMYLRGQGVTQNSDTAYSWFTRANYYGDYRARKMVAEWMQIKDRYAPKSGKVASTTTSSSSSSSSSSNTNTSEENSSGGMTIGCLAFAVFVVIIILSLKGCGNSSSPDYGVAIDSVDTVLADDSVAVDDYSYTASAKNGYDTEVFDGGKYEGNFKDGQYHGHGVMTWSNAKQGEGYKYDGEFEDGYRNGQGTMWYKGGSKYTGTWKNNERDGNGTFTWTNGWWTKFKGTFSNNRMINGTLYFSDGTKYIGRFDSNEDPCNGYLYDVNGEVFAQIGGNGISWKEYENSVFN